MQRAKTVTNKIESSVAVVAPTAQPIEATILLPETLSPKVESDYRILVSRSDKRPKAELYAFNLPDRIPQFALPLQSQDAEPWVDLQRLVHEIYDQGGYDLRLDYSREPMPSLSQTNAAWVDRLLREQRLRS